MQGHFTYDVFLSHSAKDKAVVRPLALWLEASIVRKINRRLSLGDDPRPLQMAHP